MGKFTKNQEILRFQFSILNFICTFAPRFGNIRDKADLS